MMFPETTRVGSEGHKHAIRRLEAAKEEQRRRRELDRTAHGIKHQRDAADGLAAADEQVAAREAWVKWVERGY
jgi:hypothetical protein